MGPCFGSVYHTFLLILKIVSKCESLTNLKVLPANPTSDSLGLRIVS
jgi:hypothetical protein